MDKNRAAILAEYPTPDRFVHEYAAGPEVTGELIRAAEQKGIPYDEEQFRKSETDIRTQLKALFAQKLWSVLPRDQRRTGPRVRQGARSAEKLGELQPRHIRIAESATCRTAIRL